MGKDIQVEEVPQLQMGNDYQGGGGDGGFTTR